MDASKNLSAITTKKKIDTSFEVIFVSDIVGNIADRVDKSIRENFTKSQEVLDNTVTAVSRLLDTNVVNIQKAEDKDSSATDIITKVEELSESLGDAVEDEETPLHIETPNIAAMIAKVADDEDYEVLVQDEFGSNKLSIKKDDESTSSGETSSGNKPSDKVTSVMGRISIPKKTLQNITGGFDGNDDVTTVFIFRLILLLS